MRGEHLCSFPRISAIAVPIDPECFISAGLGGGPQSFCFSVALPHFWMQNDWRETLVEETDENITTCVLYIPNLSKISTMWFGVVWMYDNLISYVPCQHKFSLKLHTFGFPWQCLFSSTSCSHYFLLTVVWLFITRKQFQTQSGIRSLSSLHFITLTPKAHFAAYWVWWRCTINPSIHSDRNMNIQIDLLLPSISELLLLC